MTPAAGWGRPSARSPNSTSARTRDAAGNRTSVTIPSGTTAYSFDALNRTEAVTDPAGGITRYAYDAAGNLTHTALPNGTSEGRAYDALNRLTFLENLGPSGVISSYRYTLAPTGRRDAVREDTGRQVTYLYDVLDRLTDERIADPSAGSRAVHYAYDPVGNRLSRDDSAEGLTAYTYDADDRLLTETLAGKATRYGYDANGNTTSKVTGAADQATYHWDAENRLVGATVIDAQGTRQLSYRYDADGIRVASTVDGAETRYLIDAVQPYAQVLEEYAAGGAVQAAYVYGNDLVSQERGGVQSYFHVDGLGSTRGLTNASGLVTDRYVYDAFGRAIGQVGTTGNVYLFAGEQRDANVGLDYLRARYMSVGAGRFTSRDSFPGNHLTTSTLHRYLYTGGDPVNNRDPSGRFTLAEVVSVSAIENVLSTISRAVIGKQVFDKVNDTIDAFETGVFFFSIGLYLALSDSLQPGFPYTVQTIDGKNHFILTNQSQGGDHLIDIDFLFHEERLKGLVNLSHFPQSQLTGDIQVTANTEQQLRFEKIFKRRGLGALKISLAFEKLALNQLGGNNGSADIQGTLAGELRLRLLPGSSIKRELKFNLHAEDGVLTPSLR
jgi:RHS repeat-associated protein